MAEQCYDTDESAAQKVLDFVAGMTDNFALQCYQEIYWL
jgi:dGTPase